MDTITPCLWFDDQAEEAARFYTSIFKDSKINTISRFPEGGPRPAGMAMVVTFEINGLEFMALNGGPEFTFNEAISLHVSCETQEEIDYLWSNLCSGGEEVQCGWLKDKYGLSWQIDAAVLQRYLGDADPEKSRRVYEAMLQMKKIDIEKLKKAYEGLN